MVENLRKNIETEQLAPYLIYILRKWKENAMIQKFENTQLIKPLSWADVSDDDDELPNIPW